VLDVVRRRVDAFDGRFVFGEFSEEFERSGCYLRSETGLHAGYNFALLVASDVAAIRDHLQTLARFPDHWPAISFSNHDVIRTASRFGLANTRVLLALLMSLRGTLLLYQGEELGLPEVDLPRHLLKDPVGDLYYPLFKGRDGCRTPMPWDLTQPHLGFSSATPWLPLGQAHAALTVSDQERDPNSTLIYARRLLAARKTHPALWDGSLTVLDGEALTFVREGGGQKIACVFNLTDSDQVQELPSPALPLDLGTGKAVPSGSRLTLSPRSAWMGTL
jgi:alpha-glucosidase